MSRGQLEKQGVELTELSVGNKQLKQQLSVVSDEKETLQREKATLQRQLKSNSTPIDNSD
jgi:hypothetical protein